MSRVEDGIVLPPPLHQFGRNVKALVISGMTAQAKRLALQQYGQRRLFHGVERFADRRVDRPRIGAVDRAAGDAVADGPVGEPLAVVLHARRRGKGVMIVFDQEQDRDLMDRGDIERFVELARAGAAVADDRQAEDLLAVAARRPGSAHDHAEHLAQMADHGEPSRRRVAMMDIALAGMRRAVGIGQVLAKELIGSGAQQQVGAEVAMQQRQHVAAGPQRHRHADRGRLVAEAHGDGAFDVSFLVQFQQPLFQAPGEEHQGIGDPIERLSPQPVGPAHQFGGILGFTAGQGRDSRQDRDSIAPQPDQSHRAGRLPRHPCQGCIDVMSRVFPIFPPGGPQNGVPDSSVTGSACHGQVGRNSPIGCLIGGLRGQTLLKKHILRRRCCRKYRQNWKSMETSAVRYCEQARKRATWRSINLACEIGR